VFIAGVLMAIGGPTLKTAISQLTKSAVKEFVLSNSINISAKMLLKEHANLNVDKLQGYKPYKEK